MGSSALNFKYEAPGRLEELDGLRGVAALMVFFSHAIGASPSSPLLDLLKSSPTRTLWDGAAAVGLFFVLSGFVLALPFLQNHRSLSYREFVIKRCFRIFPAYWAALLLALILKFTIFDLNGLIGLSDWVTNVWASPVRVEDVIRHILLVVPLDTRRIDPVIWTMVIEIKISLIFPLVIVALRTMPSVWGGAAVIVGSVVIAGVGTAHHVMFLEALPEFVAGAIIAQHNSLISRKIDQLPLAAISSFALLSLACYGKWLPLAWVEQHPRFSFHLSGCGALALIALSISWQPMRRFLSARVCQWLGQISYSFYLTHLPILLISLSLTYPISQSVAVATSIALIASLAVSNMLSKWIELPAQKVGRILIATVMQGSFLSVVLRKKEKQY
jgi:peptidoglycan/LPS O-acetylase OafA/YrhL